MKKKCEAKGCKNKFFPRTVWQKYCDPYCRHKSWRKAKKEGK